MAYCGSLGWPHNNASYEAGTGQYTTVWRDSFEDGIDSTRWAKGDWLSPFKLSRHSADGIGVKDGIAILALTTFDGDPDFSAPRADLLDEPSCGLPGYLACGP